LWEDNCLQVVGDIKTRTKEEHLNSDLSCLIKLQDNDLEIRRLKQEIASLPSRQQQIENEFSDSVREYLDLAQELENARTDRTRLETDLTSEQEKMQKFKADLMKASNEREYTTAVREIDVAKKTIGSFETEILKLLEKLEQLEAQVAERKPEIDVRRVEVDRQLTETRASVVASEERLAALVKQREVLLGSLTPIARSTYERVSRQRTGIALAEARDYSCQACRMTIRPQVFADIRRGESVITCESCGRILFFRTEVAVS